MIQKDYDKKTYDMQYKREHVFDKRVSFNDTIATDMKLQFWAEHQKDKDGKRISFNTYVKNLIYADMLRHDQAELEGKG